MPDITNLTGVGLAGFVAFLFYKAVSNHMNHNTKAIYDLASAINGLKEFMQNHVQLK